MAEEYLEAKTTIEEFLTLEPESEDGQKLLNKIEMVLGIIPIPQVTFSTEKSHDLYNRAIREYLGGEWEEAAATMRSCLSIDLNNYAALHALEEIEYKLSLSTFSTQESRNFYYEGLREYDAGELGKAAEAFKNCLNIDPDNYAASYAFADCELDMRLKSLRAKEQSTILDMLVGAVRAVIEELEPDSEFEVRTPVGIAGVRGTDFIVGTTSERTEVLVLEGTVELSDLENQKMVLVEAGESSAIVAGGLPSEPQRFDMTTLLQNYGALFESEDEIRAVVGDIEELAEGGESGGFSYYLLAIPAVVIAVVIIILVVRRRRLA